MGSSTSTPVFSQASTCKSIKSSTSCDDDSIESSAKNQAVFKNRLLNYSRYLSKDKPKLSQVEASFIPIAEALIINVMGKKQCESYQKYGSFNEIDLMIVRTICKVPYFDVDKHSEVNHLMIPLKKAFQAGGLTETIQTIYTMKSIQTYRGCSFSTIDYQLLDILEYMSQLCMNQDVDLSNAVKHWTIVLDILFRGTNVKLSNRNSKFSMQKKVGQKPNNSTKTNESIVFHCLCQNIYGVQEPIEITACHVSYRDQNDTMEENSNKEALMQNKSIMINKCIFENLTKHEEEEHQEEFYPICIHFTGYVGYVYSIRKHKGLYVASQVCERIVYIPRTLEEFHDLLYNSRVLEILCNLKRHYVKLEKVAQHAASIRNLCG